MHIVFMHNMHYMTIELEAILAELCQDFAKKILMQRQIQLLKSEGSCYRDYTGSQLELLWEAQTSKEISSVFLVTFSLQVF